MPLHSRKIRRIFYIKSRIRPKTGNKIANIHKRAEKLAIRVTKEGMTIWLKKTISSLEKKALEYNLKIKVIKEDIKLPTKKSTKKIAVKK